jgi:hypothetical protein
VVAILFSASKNANIKIKKTIELEFTNFSGHQISSLILNNIFEKKLF